MKPELKPCPFCGENNNLFVQHCEGTIAHPAYRVCCDNCGASTGYVDKANHVDNWNRRAPAKPARTPSDHEIEMLATGFSVQHRNGLLKFARALLEKCGPAQKCDGNHGGPRCADPECWNDNPGYGAEGRLLLGGNRILDEWEKS